MAKRCRPQSGTVAFATAFALVLSSCSAINADDPSLTPAQRQLRQESERFNNTVLASAAIGCLGGAVIGALLDSNNRAGGAGIGCAGGAAALGVAGYYVAARNQQYANQEQALDGLIGGAQKQAAEYRRIADQSDQLRQQDLQRIAGLKAKLSAGQLTAEQYREQTRSIGDDVALLKKWSNDSEKVQTQVEQDGAALHNRGVNTAGLTSSTGEMSAARQRLDANAEAMVKALAVS